MVLALLTGLSLGSGDALAATKKAGKPVVNEKYAAIVVDAKTGKTLHASSEDSYR